MKNRKLYSIMAAAGVLAVVLPAGASVGSAGGASHEACAAGAVTAPGKISSSTTVEQVDFSQLPPPVKATVQAQRGTDVITAIHSATQNGRVVYHVQFKGHADHARPELVVASDGTILKGKRASKTSHGLEAPAALVNW